MAEQIISRFFAVGITYHKATAEQRGLFAIKEHAVENLFTEAKSNNIRSLFVLSTCNRTEIYGYAPQAEDLIDLFIRNSQGTREIFNETGFVKQGRDAFEHLFMVAGGFDSQILGDYEVLGQMKKAVSFARERQMIGPVMDRTINFAFQASKAVKTKTQLSTGTVSVSYAAVEWLKENETIQDKRILVFGTGKFGKNIAKNLRHYLNSQVVVINRTDATAKAFAEENNLEWQPFERIAEEADKADVVIVSTHATEYTIVPRFFSSNQSKCILDLSVPLNVDPSVQQIKGIRLIGIDEVSMILKKTMEKRNAELPQAKAILSEHLREFYEWLDMQKHVQMIRDVKNKLHHLGSHPEANNGLIHDRVNKTVTELAINLRQKTEKGCQYIRAFNEFLQPVNAG